jgi:RND family efflux transporter MFP subunit
MATSVNLRDGVRPPIKPPPPPSVATVRYQPWTGTLDAQVKSASAQLTAARERLRSDQARLDQLLAGPTDEDLRQAEAAVDAAAQQLTLARQPSTDQDIRAQRAALEQAQLQLQKARTPYTDFELQQQRQAVAQAEAQLRSKQNPYTEQDLQAAQATVDQARAQLELAELGLNETRVLAPADGLIAARLIAPGALVNPQTPIVTLVPPSLELVVNVEESHLGELAEGQAVELQVAAFPTQTFAGVVKTIAPTVDEKSRTAEVRVEPKDDSNRLRAGMFAQLNIVTAARQNTLVVPREAILAAGAGSSRMVVAIDASGKTHRQPVTLGLQNERQAEVLSGLQYGQLAATSGMNDLKDGDLVAPQIRQLAAQGPTQ